MLWATGVRAQPAGAIHAGPAPTDRSAPALYGAYCANCHGAQARGDGPLSAQLSMSVPDLRRGMRVSSSTDPTAFTVQDVTSVLERGVPDSPMPSYAGLFTKPELEALSRHVIKLAGVDEKAPALDLGPAPEPSQDNVVEGAFIYARAGCALCHGHDGRGGPAPQVPRRNDDGSVARFPDLTKPVTWRGGQTARDIAARVAKGVPGTPMPTYRPALKDRELWLVALYVESLAEVTALPALAEAWAAQPVTMEPAERGTHLWQVNTCYTCHQAERPGSQAGITAVDLGPFGVAYAGHVTQAQGRHQRGQIAEQLKAALHQGLGVDGRRLSPIAMPWHHYAAFSDADVDAMAEVLSTQPRAPRPVPPRRDASWGDQLTRKISAAARVSVLEARLGPVPEGGGPGADPRYVAAAVMGVGVLVWFVMLMLALGGAKRGRSRRTATAFVPLPVAALLAALMIWPAHDLLPEGQLRTMMGAPLPEPEGIREEAARRLALRGRDLVSAAACASCHTAYNPYQLGAPRHPLAGGTRLRGRSFGRVYASNLTPDGNTGLGGWSREEMRRAIRGGVGRDGRVFHPQAMPYDHFGGYTDVELEAIITYLRAIPAITHRMPERGTEESVEGMAWSLFDYGE
ncbi:MAG: c-type cytochrome [Myxococcota bacterium]